MTPPSEKLLAALAPLALAAAQEARSARAIAASRGDAIEQAAYLDRAERWQALYEAAAAAMEASVAPDYHPPAAREMPVYVESP